MDVNVRIAGEAGQGVDTMGTVLTGALARLGLFIFGSQNVMSRIRGGLNWFDIRLSDEPLYSGREDIDLLVALSTEALDALRPRLAPGGLALFNGAEIQDTIAIDFTAVAKQTGGSPIMANTVAAGAVFSLLGYTTKPLLEHIAETFNRKGADVVEANERCMQRGAELALATGKRLDAPPPAEAPATFYSGSEAIGLAAATAGVKFVTAYPMSPSTATFTYLAGVADRYGLVIEQAEDEIAAINMIAGATYAGVPAMTTTSGGGFALMTEGFSLAGIAELPIVVLLAQRPGPATGLPTHTAQEDLRFVLHAGHGEFPRAIFAPGTPAQAYELTRRALELAHEFQTPVVILIDQHLADLIQTSVPLDTAYRPIDRCLLADPPPEYHSYALTESGVSPRAIPGSGAVVVRDSHVHTEDGHITEDPDVCTRMTDKRAAKHRGMVAKTLPPEWYGPEDARRLFVCWGSTYGPCREAVDVLNADGASVAMVHWAQVWPLDIERARTMLAGKPVTVVEGNSTGQFASILRVGGVLTECDSLLQYNGLPFTADGIVRRSRS